MFKVKYIKLAVSALFSVYFIFYATHAEDLSNWNLIDNVDLIIHEAGHTLFSFFGESIHILGGSLFQILVPIVFVIYFAIWRRELYSASILLFWVGQNILNVAVYMGDAIQQKLPLLGGDSVIHDWNYILSSTGLLMHTNILSTIFYNFGFLVIITASVLCFYFSCFSDRIRE